MDPNALILGAFYGLKKADVSVFVNSLFKTGYRGRLVLFAAAIDKETHEFLLNAGVTVLGYDHTQAHALMPIHAFRYFLYKNFLADVKESFSPVMLTDVRDVAFQRDPFDFQVSSGLHVFLEEQKTIGECPYNSLFVKKRFGAEELAHLSAFRISCSGITIGPGAAIRAYLERLCQLLLPSLKLVGYDQGAHNHLVHRRLLSDVTVHENGDGPVLTLGYMDPEMIKTDPGGLVIGRSGQVVNILHQYDRCGALAQSWSVITENSTNR
jgi:hypothetical protein